MKTIVLKPDEQALQKAAALIQSGQLVGFPTETVYGLGADALNGEAVKSIFAAKGRPGDNPLIVHISELSQIEPLIHGPLSETAQRMAEAFWPGPLTMIFPKSERIPDAVSAGLDTVGIRLPSHPTARALISAAQCSIAAPSANRSGRPSPTTAEHVFEDMDGRIPLILDGGACAVGLESTVVDMTGDIPRVLRPGGVTAEQIADVVGACEVDGAVMRPLAEGEKPRSPGMKYRHYAPKGSLTLFSGQPEKVCEALCAAYDDALAAGQHPLLLALKDHIPLLGERRTESFGENVEDMARSVFAVLRDADTLGVDVIFSEAVEAKGLGLAVMNRLGRAAAFHIVNV